MRAIVIADCHARPELITNALEHVKYNQCDDRLIFAGDFLDIGYKADECLDILLAAGAEMLWGNHEAAILYGERISPQSEVSWEYQGLFKLLVRGPDRWRVMTEHDGVLVSHAGVSQVYWKVSEGGVPAQGIVHYFNDRFQHIDIKEIADEFWDSKGPLWFRPGLLAPLSGFVQVCGHTPPQYLPQDDGYFSVDPYVQSTVGRSEDRFRYAVIEDGEVSIYDSNEV